MKKQTVTIHPRHSNEEPQQLDLEELIEESDWDPEDPGKGKAVLLPDGRELLNPMPMAPPVGYFEQPSMFEIMEKMIKQHYAGLADRDIEETEEESQDLDTDEDQEFLSPFEIVMMDDFPGTPPAPPAEPDPPPPPAPSDPPAPPEE